MRSKWTLVESSECILASSPSSITIPPQALSRTVSPSNALFALSSRKPIHHPSFPSFYVSFLLSVSFPSRLPCSHKHAFVLSSSAHLGAHLRPTLMREGATGFAGLAPRISKQTQQDATRQRRSENYLSLRRFLLSFRIYPKCRN